MYAQTNWSFILLLAIAAAAGSGYSLFVHYAGLPPRKAFGAWLIAVAAALIGWLFRYRALRDSQIADRYSLIIGSIAAGFFLFLTTAFVLRLHRQWLEASPDAAEKPIDANPFRAWFTLGNLFLVALLTFLGWLGFGIPISVTLLLTCGALALKPLFAFGREPLLLPLEGLSSEREKILSLLETGKITADESAELLNALGAATAVQPQSARPLSFSRRLAMLGVGCVVVGFFLPWFSFSLGGELSRMMQQAPPATGALSRFDDAAFPKMITVLDVTGADVGKGLGWMVLILALIGTLAPHLGLSWDRLTRRTMQMLALGMGSVILLYLMTQNFRMVRIGLVLVVAGYVIQWIALLREEPLLIPHRLPREEGV